MARRIARRSAGVPRKRPRPTAVLSFALGMQSGCIFAMPLDVNVYSWLQTWTPLECYESPRQATRS